MIGLALVTSVGLVIGANTYQPPASTYQPPTSAAVHDPFRPPPKPWMAGNRGIEYDTEPGAVVRSIGDGQVAFAGPVAGRTVVAVVHPDGLRSMYSGLAVIDVQVGQKVTVGTRLGTTQGRFHLGVRLGRTYLDPASLWGRSRAPGRPVLVPLERRQPRAPPRSPWALDGLVTTLTAGPPPGESMSNSPASSQRSLTGNFLSVLRKQASKKPLERSGS